MLASKCISKLLRSWSPYGLLYSLNHRLQAHLQTYLITIMKCITELRPSQHATAAQNSQNRSIEDCSVSASKLAWLSPETATLSVLILSHQVHHPTRLIAAPVDTSKPIPSSCGELAQLLLPSKGFSVIDLFCLIEYRMRVRVYEGVSNCEELQTMCGSMNAHQDYRRKCTNCND